MDKAFEIALQDVKNYTSLAREDVERHMNFVATPDVKELVIFFKENVATLAWHFDFHPNLREKWSYVVDAHTGEVYKNIKSSCSLHNHDFGNNTTHNHDHGPTCSVHKPLKEKLIIEEDAVVTAFSGTGRDLLGLICQINPWVLSGHWMLRIHPLSQTVLITIIVEMVVAAGMMQRKYLVTTMVVKPILISIRYTRETLSMDRGVIL